MKFPEVVQINWRTGRYLLNDFLVWLAHDQGFSDELVSQALVFFGSFDTHSDTDFPHVLLIKAQEFAELHEVLLSKNRDNDDRYESERDMVVLIQLTMLLNKIRKIVEKYAQSIGPDRREKEIVMSQYELVGQLCSFLERTLGSAIILMTLETQGEYHYHLTDIRVSQLTPPHLE